MDANDASGLESYARRPDANPHAVYYLPAAKAHVTALMYAAMCRQPIAVSWCIRYGLGRSSVDKADRRLGRTALMFACGAVNDVPTVSSVRSDAALECVRLLVSAHAGVAVRSKPDVTGKLWGTTLGVQVGFSPTCFGCVRRGACAATDGAGLTAVHYAALNGLVAVVRFLLWTPVSVDLAADVLEVVQRRRATIVGPSDVTDAVVAEVCCEWALVLAG